MVEDTGIGGIGVGLRRLVWVSGFVTAVAFAIAAGWLLQAEIEPIDATGSEILESATAHRASILALWVFWNAAVLAQLVFLTAFALAVWRGGNTVAALLGGAAGAVLTGLMLLAIWTVTRNGIPFGLSPLNVHWDVRPMVTKSKF